MSNPFQNWEEHPKLNPYIPRIEIKTPPDSIQILQQELASVRQMVEEMHKLLTQPKTMFILDGEHIQTILNEIRSQKL